MKATNNEQKVYRTKQQIQWISIFFIVLGSFPLACSSTNTCQTDYNCPDNQYCVRQQCQTQKPPGYQPPSWQVPPWADLPGTDASTSDNKQKPKEECQKGSDCTDPDRPHCFQKQCTKGYLSFDFKGGHLIIDPQAPAKRCKKKEDCQKWQECHLAYCRDIMGLKSKVEGKIGKSSFFMNNYSFSEFVKKQGQDHIRIVLVGTVSAKIQHRLVLTMPSKGFVLGPYTLDGDKITAILYEVRTEFTPAKHTILGFATGGIVKIFDAGYALGHRVSGLASLKMHPAP